ncbi:hypothetical protein [Dactylosporangium cerinum]
MQMIDDLHDALAVLHDPAFVVPPVPPATAGVAWLRSTVGRFSTGEAHTRRRALSESLLSTVDPVALREAAASSPHAHPVQLLAAALGLDSSPRTTDAVRAVAAAYQPGTGDEAAADLAVRVLIDTFGGTPDELIAARIGVLVQACDATATLIDRARTTDLETALRDTPPVPATKRMATRSTDLNAAHAAADHPAVAASRRARWCGSACAASRSVPARAAALAAPTHSRSPRARCAAAPVQRSVVWESVVWESVVRRSTAWGSVVWGSVVWGSVVWGSVVWGSVVWGSTAWGSVVRWSVVWGSVVWGSVVWGSMVWQSTARRPVARRSTVRWSTVVMCGERLPLAAPRR